MADVVVSVAFIGGIRERVTVIVAGTSLVVANVGEVKGVTIEVIIVVTATTSDQFAIVTKY